ncbi:MAG: hypothetical protein ACXW1Z_25530 [Methylobacter sp.]
MKNTLLLGSLLLSTTFAIAADQPASVTPVAASAAAIRPGIQRMPAKAVAWKTWLKPVERVCSIALRSINVHHLPAGPELTDALETTDVFINNPRFRCS